MLATQITILLALLLFSAFFSGVETALMSVNKIKVQALIKQKRKGSLPLKRIKDKPKDLIIAILIGNNLVNIGAASYATVISTKLFGNNGLGIATGVMTLLVLIFGEITPKTYAASNAERISLIVARPIEMLMHLLRPVIALLRGISHVMAHLLGSNDEEELSEEELSTVVSMGVKHGLIDPEAGEMMHNIIEFQDTEAGEIMTRKSHMKLIDGNKTVEEVIDFVVANKFSRYPVYEDDDEKIIGILDVDDVLRCAKNKQLNKKVKEIMRDVVFIPESKQIDDLLTEFEGADVPMAMVVDEYGEISGLITMEDILEEIVGEIFDKSKKPSKFIKRLGPNVNSVDATMQLCDLNKVLNLSIEPEDNETLAGYIMEKMQKIPEKGEKLELKNYILEVQKVTKQKIERVKIIKK